MFKSNRRNTGTTDLLIRSSKGFGQEDAYACSYMSAIAFLDFDHGAF
jgi:hypothetical protein